MANEEVLCVENIFFFSIRSYS